MSDPHSSVLMRQHLGIFRGFGESRDEISGEILIPYSPRMPLQGGFLVIGVEDFENNRCGILGRVVRAFPLGDLSSAAGEEYLIDLIKMKIEVPREVLEGRLRYRIALRLLGQLTEREGGRVEFSPALRIMPHLGAPVGLPSDKVMRMIGRGSVAEGDEGPQIGHLSVGDLAFDGAPRAGVKSFPNYPVHFRMDSLVGRRTAVFARAGMGKSNFTKVLLARLYSTDPGCGTLVIDPEGEYAFANASEPGLLDVPALRDRVVVYTDREDIDPRYAKSIAGGTRIDFAGLPPEDAVSNLLPEEKQGTVFASMLRSLKPDAWARLVAVLEKDGYRTNHAALGKIMEKAAAKDGYDVVLGAVVNNLVPAIKRLHSSKSTLLTRVKEALTAGKIVIVDVSMLSGTDARLTAAWLLGSIFTNNQLAYTSGRRGAQRMIPCLAVLEEAQFYLGENAPREDSPFVRWFKEGRKFSLGSILVTQQPGAIDASLVSQCDNFFVFHLLSRHDLRALSDANLHFASDISTSIGAEPIPGNCFLWSSRGLSFVTCARILPFRAIAGDPPPEPVSLRAETVTLPVLYAPGQGDGDAERAIRHAIEKDLGVHLFTPLLLDGEDWISNSALLAVSLDYLTRSANAFLGKTSLTPELVVAEVMSLELAPFECRGSGVNVGEVVVLERAKFETAGKRIKNTLKVKLE